MKLLGKKSLGKNRGTRKCHLANRVQKNDVIREKFVEAGGKLMAGTDPIGFGGVVADFSNQRVIELLVEMGFSVDQAIEIYSLNSARYLEREQFMGCIEVGGNADLVLIDGCLTKNTSATRDIETVLKNGTGYSTSKIKATIKAVVSLH